MSKNNPPMPEADLVRGIHLPHTANPAGKWLLTKAAPLFEPNAALDRLIFYARRLRTAGFSDADITCMFSDLYWDAVREMDLNRKAGVGLPDEVPLPASPQVLSKLWAAADAWETAYAVSIEAVEDQDHYGVQKTSCYLEAENKLRDAIEAVYVERGEPVRSERVLPSFGELEQAARERLEPDIHLDEGPEIRLL